MANFSNEREEIKRLRTAVSELSILNDIALAVSTTRDLDDVIDMVVQRCVKHLNVEQGTVILVDNDSKNSPFKTMVRKMDSRIDVVPYHFGLQLSGWMLKNQAPLLINDFQNDHRFKLDTDQSFQIRNILSVPMRLKGNLIGVLNVFNKHGGEGFTEEDKRLLSIISAQSAQVIESARLYEEEKTLTHLNEELKVAGEIQKRLLPATDPEIKGYEICGENIPAREMGGDYFDFIPLSDGKLAICLGDVSGKGITAALLMSNLQATIRSQSLLNPSSEQAIGKTNLLLYNSTDTDKFVTCFYCILDPVSHTIESTNAGHDYPVFFYSNGSQKRLKKGGPILGFMADIGYESEVTEMAPGDLVMIYSDGLTDAIDSDGDEFGEKRLLDFVKGHITLPIKELSDLIFTTIGTFSGSNTTRDDMTLVLLRRNILDR